MATICLLRHGETEWNQSARFQGQTDTALNELGWRQAELLAERLRDHRFAAYYSSDLTRARETARILAPGQEVVLDRRLREVDVGHCAGLTVAQVQLLEGGEFWRRFRQDPEATPFPEGESALDLQARVLAALEEIAARHGEGTAAVVGHGGVIKMAVCATLGLPLSGRGRFAVDNCSISLVRWQAAGRRTLLRLNDTAHLRELQRDVRLEF